LTRRVLALFRPYRGRLAAVLALIVASAGLGTISPFLLRDVLDVAIPRDDDGLLIALVAGMIGISVATGLAVTGTGGDVLFVEATMMRSHPPSDSLVLTGQLGDVMKESARIALSYVRGHAGELGVDDEAFDGREFHVHVPAGAIPKDGPSAGITMTTALASLLSGRPVKHTVGMTGEVTLQGRVLPIGGLKQKVLAAHAAGITEVILPERNRGDLDDVPADVREQMTFHPVMSIGEVLEKALEPAPLKVAA
jgi:ATP-dependent Lon protease